MFEFFTKIFTPLFITLGFINPAPEPIAIEPVPVVEQIAETPQVATSTLENVASEPVREIAPTPEPQPINETPVVVTESVITPEVAETVSLPETEPVEPIVARDTEPEVIEMVLPKPKCGPADKDTFLTIPDNNLCEVGIVADTSLEDNEHSWKCASGDAETSCMAFITEHGACGVSSDVLLPASYKSSTLCSAGTVSQKQSGYGELTWTCQGINDGYDAQCSASTASAGACGVAHATKSQYFPSSNLCRFGEVSSRQTSSDKYVWECTGINGGSNASCFATIPEPANTVTPCYKDAFLTPC